MWKYKAAIFLCKVYYFVAVSFISTVIILIFDSIPFSIDISSLKSVLRFVAMLLVCIIIPALFGFLLYLRIEPMLAKKLESTHR